MGNRVESNFTNTKPKKREGEREMIREGRGEREVRGEERGGERCNSKQLAILN